MMLFVSDRQSLTAGEWLTERVINCAQKFLKSQYSHIIGGLEMTTMGNTLTYSIEKGEFVHIFNVRNNLKGGFQKL